MTLTAEAVDFTGDHSGGALQSSDLTLLETSGEFCRLYRSNSTGNLVALLPWYLDFWTSEGDQIRECAKRHGGTDVIELGAITGILPGEDGLTHIIDFDYFIIEASHE